MEKRYKNSRGKWGPWQDDGTTMEWWRNFLDGSPSREEILNERINRAVDGIETSKMIQDHIAGITRRG